MRFVRIKLSVVPLTIDFGMLSIKSIPLTMLEWIDLARKREKLLKTAGISKGVHSLLPYKCVGMQFWLVWKTKPFLPIYFFMVSKRS